MPGMYGDTCGECSRAATHVIIMPPTMPGAHSVARRFCPRHLWKWLRLMPTGPTYELRRR